MTRLLALCAATFIASSAAADPSASTTEAATASTTASVSASTNGPEGTAARPEGTTRAWPLAIDFHFVAGVEPHDIGTPPIFGTGIELLHRARLGFFADLISTNGGKVNAQTVANPGIPDRISIPFGVAVRPLAYLLRPDNRSYWARLARGFGADAGVSIEIMRTSDDSKVEAAFSLAGYVDVPLYGEPRTGGVALRVMGRGIFAASHRFESDGSIYAPSANGQLLFGVTVTL